MADTRTLIKTLAGAGLNEKQARVYVALVTTGEATAYKVAEVSGLKKPTTYVILEELRLQGLAGKVPHTKRTLYRALPFSDFLTARERALTDASHSLPLLRALEKKPTASILYFTGADGVAQAAHYKADEMRDKTFNSFYGNLEGAPKEITAIYDAWERAMLAQNTHFRIVMSHKDPAKYYPTTVTLAKKHSHELALRTVARLPLPPSVSLEIGTTFVRIINASAMTATIIDDKEVADTHRAIFEVVWGVAK